MNIAIIICLAIAALAHIPPVAGVLGAATLKRLYGVEISDPNLLLLMQHRGMLFAVVAAVLLFAVFKPEFRLFAILVGLLSTVSFIVLARPLADFDPLIVRVVRVDWVLIAALLVALVLQLKP